MKKLLLFSVILFEIQIAKSEVPSNWIPVSQTSNVYQVSFPNSPSYIVDTLDMSAYKYNENGIEITASHLKLDTTFVSILNSFSEDDSLLFEENDPLNNPAYGITEFYKYYYDSVQVIEQSNILLQDSSLVCWQLVIKYLDFDRQHRIFSIRAYFDGVIITNFTVSALVEEEQLFYSMKNSFYNSIVIN